MRAKRFHWAQGALYLHRPEGFGRSDLAARLARYLPGLWTARNLRSARARADLAQSLPSAPVGR